MNGDMDFMVLNGKLKDIQGSNTRQENSLSAIDDKMTDVSDKMTDVSDKMTDVSNKMDNLSVDVSVGAVIVCRGSIGTSFKLTRVDKLYPDLTTEITENSKNISDGLYAEIVSVPCGEYSIEVNVSGTIINTTVNASEIGHHYLFNYSCYVEIQRFYNNGTFVVPSISFPFEENTVYIDAIAAGGSGGSGLASSGSYAGGGGGGGGGGGRITKGKYTVQPGTSISITVGKGNSNSAGGSTVIGSLVTLTGGSPGSDGTYSGSSHSGTGGAGGAGGSPNGTSGYKGGDGSGGVGGSGGYGGQGLYPDFTYYGSGGTGATAVKGTTIKYGSTGTSGIVVIYKKAGVY